MTTLTAAAMTGANVLYIDTLGSFSPSRIEEMFRKNPLFSGREDLDQVFSKIRCVRAHDIFQVTGAIESLLRELDNEGGQSRATRLVIIDSVASVVTPVLMGAAGGSLFMGHSLMTALVRMLKCLAVDHNVAVLLTNHVVSGGKLAPGEPRPALGATWSYTSNIQLFLCPKPNDQTLSKRQIECRKTSRVCGFSISPVVHRLTTFYFCSEMWRSGDCLHYRRGAGVISLWAHFLLMIDHKTCK